MHALRHTFATNLVNGVKQPDGTIKALSPKQVADILGHATSQVTEMYYVKKDTSRLNGITDGFEIQQKTPEKSSSGVSKFDAHKQRKVFANMFDAKMMLQQTELFETDAAVCEIDAHFQRNEIKIKRKEYNKKRLKLNV